MSHEGFFKGTSRQLRERNIRGRGGDEGKIKWKLSEVNTRAVSKGQKASSRWQWVM
jgi:hypothetical protein